MFSWRSAIEQLTDPRSVVYSVGLQTWSFYLTPTPGSHFDFFDFGSQL